MLWVSYPQDDPLLQQILRGQVGEAVQARRRLADLGGSDDAAQKQALLAKAEVAVEQARIAADLLVFAWLDGESPAEREKLRRRNLSDVTGGDVDWDKLRARVREKRRKRSPLHWPLAFPEVFLDGAAGAGGGFDAVVGNPPFLGGQKLTGVFGKPFREWLVEVLGGGVRGSADFVAYFFLRAWRLLRPGGAMGLLATNTIAQGDTREVGLDQLVADGASIFRARASMPWPGEANLEVAVVHAVRGPWAGERSQPVPVGHPRARDARV